MDHSSILDESIIDVSGSRSLKPSRRRVQKGSAVVLNADRLRKMADNRAEAVDSVFEENVNSHADNNPTGAITTSHSSPSPDHDQHPSSSSVSPEQMLQMFKPNPKVTRSPVEKIMPRAAFSSPNLDELMDSDEPKTQVKVSPDSAKMIQLLHKDMSAGEAAKIICQWYKHKISRRMDNFTQHGLWQYATAEKVHALVLGHRVRSMFKKNAEIKRLIASQRDVRGVLQDLLRQQYDNGVFVMEDALFKLKELIRNANDSLHGVDQQLAVSLIKELLADREKLIKYIFHQRRFISFPKPGHWNLYIPAVKAPAPSDSTPWSGNKLKEGKSSESTPQRTRKISLQSFATPSDRHSTPSSENHSNSANRPRSTPNVNTGAAKWQQETPPHVKRAMEQQTTKVPVKLYVGNNHRSLIDESLSHAQSLSEYLDMPLQKVEDSPEAEAAASHYLVDDRPIRGSSAVDVASSSVWNADGDTSMLSSFTSIGTKKKSMRISRPLAAAASSNISSGHRHQQKYNLQQPHTVERKRNQEGCHIQLEIISGDKLIPAKKGALTKDSVPDRKPNLKITLFLPGHMTTSTSSASSTPSVPTTQSALKKISHVVRDFEEMTFFPVWNASFYLSLPMPRALLRSVFENVAGVMFASHPQSREDLEAISVCAQEVLAHEKERIDSDPNLLDHVYPVYAVQLSDTQYDIITRYLLHHWAAGNVLIEVLDGERFNEDIFMGQSVLLLTSFLPSIRKLTELEIKGSYTLEKQRTTNRVSGSISLQAFWHAPEKAYLEEQLTPIIQELLRKQLQQQQHHHHHHHHHHEHHPSDIPGGMKMGAKISQKLSHHQQQRSNYTSPSFDDEHHRHNVSSDKEDDMEEALGQRVNQLQDFMKFFEEKRTDRKSVV